MYSSIADFSTVDPVVYERWVSSSDNAALHLLAHPTIAFPLPRSKLLELPDKGRVPVLAAIEHRVAAGDR